MLLHPLPAKYDELVGKTVVNENRRILGVVVDQYTIGSRYEQTPVIELDNGTIIRISDLETENV